MMRFTLAIAAVFVIALSTAAYSQADGNFNHKAQKDLIPADLGEVFLGMPFAEFVKKIDIAEAEADTRFDFISLNIPISKGSIIGLTVRVAGVERDEIESMTRKVEITEKDDIGGYTRTVERIDPAKATGFVYALYIEFDPEFDLRSHVLKTYGDGGDVRKPDDPYHFYDIQWTKKTDDGLTWLIRSFHEGDGRSLQLLGRISGTEWAVD